MLSNIFTIIGNLARTSLDLFASLARGLLDLFSAFASVILWPVKAVFRVIFGDYSVSAQWTPLYLLACGILLVMLVLIAAWVFWNNFQRRKKG